VLQESLLKREEEYKERIVNIQDRNTSLEMCLLSAFSVFLLEYVLS